MFEKEGNLVDPAQKYILAKVFEKQVDPSVEVKGDNVVFTLKSPYAPFLSQLPHYLSQVEGQPGIRFSCNLII